MSFMTHLPRLKFALQQRLAEILHLVPGSCLCLTASAQLGKEGDLLPPKHILTASGAV
jgi:hypothetical protein